MSFFNLRGTVKQIGKPATGQEKIFENHVSDKELIHKIYKELNSIERLNNLILK